MVDVKIEEIVWYYSIRQETFFHLSAYMKTKFPDITLKFVEGLPPTNYTEIYADRKARVIILDDLMSEICNSNLTDIFTRGSHHLNISIFFLTQNLFFKSKHSRTINLNTHYLILFKNARDASAIRHLALQVFPTNSKYLIQSYEDAVSIPYGYILLDFKTQDDTFRVRSNILPEDKVKFVYLPTQQKRI